MPYTLMKGLAWVLLAVLLGIVIGWLLRSVAARRQIERAKRERSESDDQAELERLQAQVANLEPVVNERDRLRSQLERLEAEQSLAPQRDPSAASAADPPPSVTEGGATTSGAEASGAATVHGVPVTLDDLTVVKGIGPNTAELCHGIGIRTWAELAATEVSLLRTMLDDAGARFKTHDPSTWPEQARLLAAGDWGEFAALAERLDGGRPSA